MSTLRLEPTPHAGRGFSCAIDRAHNAHVNCVYPVLISCCDVRVGGVAREIDKVNQRTKVKKSERKRERENARGRKRERAREYA